MYVMETLVSHAIGTHAWVAYNTITRAQVVVIKVGLGQTSWFVEHY